VWVGGALWQPLTALTQLAVTASCYTTLTVEELPRTLRQVSATAHAIYCDIPILLGCPEVDLVARELYLIANTPQNNEEMAAFIWPLAHLGAHAGGSGAHTGPNRPALHAGRASSGIAGGGWRVDGASRSRPACRAAAAACCSTPLPASFADDPFSGATPRVQAVWYTWGPTGEPAWLRADQEPVEDPGLLPRREVVANGVLGVGRAPAGRGCRSSDPSNAASTLGGGSSSRCCIGLLCSGAGSCGRCCGAGRSGSGAGCPACQLAAGGSCG
jgi:hypothetical protein